MDDKYSQKEEDTFRKELFRRLDKQDTILERMLEQTTKTNGRVTKIETQLEDYPEIKSTVYKHQNYIWYVLGIVFIVGGIGLFTAKSFINEIVRETIKEEKTNG